MIWTLSSCSSSETLPKCLRHVTDVIGVTCFSNFLQHQSPFYSNLMFSFSSLSYTNLLFSFISSHISVQCFTDSVCNCMLNIHLTNQIKILWDQESRVSCLVTTQCLTYSTCEIQINGDVNDHLPLNHPCIYKPDRRKKISFPIKPSILHGG